MELTVNEQQVYCATGGAAWRAGQPLLVLVHGAAMDHTVWTLLSRYFARAGFNVMAPDLPGHGHSGGQSFNTVAAYADWLEALLDRAAGECASDRLIIGGHSLGSLIALETAGRLQQRLNGLILMGTCLPMQVGELLLDSAGQNLPLSRDIIAIYGHAYASRLGANPIAGISVLNMALRLMAQAGDNVMFDDLTACNEYRQGLDAAERVSAPTTLILGELDQMTPPARAVELGAALDNALTLLLPGSGHMMMGEQPEQTLQAIRQGVARALS